MRKKRVKATTNNVTQAIINHARSKGHYAGRINNTGVFDPVIRIYRKLPKDELGKFDIYICCGGGLSLWIDVKTGSDRPSDEQLLFQEQIRNNGGIAEFISTYDEYLELYERRVGV